jgi:hypothetical protein
MMLAVHKEKGDLPESGWLREESTQREVTSWITPDDV